MCPRLEHVSDHMGGVHCSKSMEQSLCGVGSVISTTTMTRTKRCYCLISTTSCDMRINICRLSGCTGCHSISLHKGYTRCGGAIIGRDRGGDCTITGPGLRTASQRRTWFRQSGLVTNITSSHAASGNLKRKLLVGQFLTPTRELLVFIIILAFLYSSATTQGGS